MSTWHSEVCGEKQSFQSGGTQHKMRSGDLWWDKFDDSEGEIGSSFEDEWKQKLTMLAAFEKEGERRSWKGELLSVVELKKLEGSFGKLKLMCESNIGQDRRETQVNMNLDAGQRGRRQWSGEEETESGVDQV